MCVAVLLISFGSLQDNRRAYVPWLALSTCTMKNINPTVCLYLARRCIYYWSDTLLIHFCLFSYYIYEAKLNIPENINSFGWWRFLNIIQMDIVKVFFINIYCIILFDTVFHYLWNKDTLIISFYIIILYTLYV